MATLTINNAACGIPEVEDECYGYLYNWYAVDDARNLTNTGWHVMTWSDMLNLVDYVTGSSHDYLDAGDNLGDGGELKTEGTTYWQSPNINATNEYGFSAIGSGMRLPPVGFMGLNEFTSFYTSDRETSTPEPPYVDEVGILSISNGTTFGYSFMFGLVLILS